MGQKYRGMGMLVACKWEVGWKRRSRFLTDMGSRHWRWLRCAATHRTFGAGIWIIISIDIYRISISWSGSRAAVPLLYR